MYCSACVFSPSVYLCFCRWPGEDVFWLWWDWDMFSTRKGYFDPRQLCALLSIPGRMISSFPDCPVMAGVILLQTAMSRFILLKRHFKERSSLSRVWNAGYSQGHTFETVFWKCPWCMGMLLEIACDSCRFPLKHLIKPSNISFVSSWRTWCFLAIFHFRSPLWTRNYSLCLLQTGLSGISRHVELIASLPPIQVGASAPL